MKASGIFLIIAGILLSCGQKSENVKDIVAKPQINKAIGVLYPASGSNVTGVVEFNKTDGGIQVIANISGLTPGKHGFHIHQYGDCSSFDAESAGGHYNPTEMDHGAPGDPVRHVGDFGNLVADTSGKATMNFVDTIISFNGNNSIIGRALVIHANEDDMKSQPTGNAGPRLACGVIGVRSE